MRELSLVQSSSTDFLLQNDFYGSLADIDNWNPICGRSPIISRQNRSSPPLNIACGSANAWFCRSRLGVAPRNDRCRGSPRACSWHSIQRVRHFQEILAEGHLHPFHPPHQFRSPKPIPFYLLRSHHNSIITQHTPILAPNCFRLGGYAAPKIHPQHPFRALCRRRPILRPMKI